jgi:protein CpxP
MTRTIVTLATLLAAAGIANAQTTSPSAPSATTPPAGGSSTTMPGSSGAGSTASMSMSAVKSKIEASGYSNVTNLKQDNTGNWTASATKGGQQVAVQVDSKGTVKQAQQ